MNKARKQDKAYQTPAQEVERTEVKMQEHKCTVPYEPIDDFAFWICPECSKRWQCVHELDGWSWYKGVVFTPVQVTEGKTNADC